MSEKWRDRIYRVGFPVAIIMIVSGVAIATAQDPGSGDGAHAHLSLEDKIGEIGIRVDGLESRIDLLEGLASTTTTTEAPTTTTDPPTTTTTTPIALPEGTWTLRADGTGPIWTPPVGDDGFLWYPNSRGARIGWLTDTGTWDYGSRGDEGFDATGPLEDSQFHYWDNAWVSALGGLQWRVDGTRQDGTPFEEFWISPDTWPPPEVVAMSLTQTADSFNITATSTSDLPVDQVDFLIDGVPYRTEFNAPYTVGGSGRDVTFSELGFVAGDVFTVTAVFIYTDGSTDSGDIQVTVEGYVPDPLTPEEDIQPADPCIAPYPCVIPEPTTPPTYPTVDPVA